MHSTRTAKHFKFHCDSINMRERCTQQEQQLTLNSTVILLILGEERGKRVLVLDFKFHCDSINIICVLFSDFYNTNFKFHCDSINMRSSSILPPAAYPLNSTVILLISRFLCTWREFDRALNSTVILLI